MLIQKLSTVIEFSIVVTWAEVLLTGKEREGAFWGWWKYLYLNWMRVT